jgi:hypothetical protein
MRLHGGPGRWVAGTFEDGRRALEARDGSVEVSVGDHDLPVEDLMRARLAQRRAGS